ncbi:MAG: stalk domain-containing protein [Defluviitaleaceae bacterium]|nr:stalk domain-containing protein [Defluviitaleaceae bacterium]
MKKEKLKYFVVGVLTTVVLLTSTIVWANPQGTMREVFGGLSVVVHGQRMSFYDDQEPFISEGRVFIPTSVISDGLGVAVSWDGASRTLYVGRSPVGQGLWEVAPPFQGSQGQFRPHLASVLSHGNAFGNAVRVTRHGGPSASWSEHNLNAQFTTLTGTVGRIDGTTGNNPRPSTITFLGDGRELATFVVDRNSHPEEVSVDITGVLVLRIEFSQPGNMMMNERIWPFFADPLVQ